MDFEKLYELCFMKVYSYAMTFCRDPILAEEVTQEAFFRAMRSEKRSEFREQSAEYTWLCAIARNVYNDEMRRRRRLCEMPEDAASEEDLAATLDDRETTFRIHRALHTLDEPYKEVFELRVFGELPYEQIAELFGKSETWARVTYHRAKLKIRERMDNNGSDTS